MRDAFGGVFTMNFMLVFIFIFVAFAAVSFNYAKAFRLKNSIIDFVEEKEITSLSNGKISSTLTDMDTIITNANYNKTCESLGSTIGLDLKEGEYKVNNKLEGYCHKGVFIKLASSQSIQGTTSKIIKYDIIVAADWNLGALNKILALGGEKENSKGYITGSWAITGEAKVIAK